MFGGDRDVLDLVVVVVGGYQRFGLGFGEFAWFVESACDEGCDDFFGCYWDFAAEVVVDVGGDYLYFVLGDVEGE